MSFEEGEDFIDGRTGHNMDLGCPDDGVVANGCKLTVRRPATARIERVLEGDRLLEVTRFSAFLQSRSALVRTLNLRSILGA